MGLLIAGILLWTVGNCLCEFSIGLQRMLGSLKFVEYEDPCKCEENGGGK